MYAAAAARVAVPFGGVRGRGRLLKVKRKRTRAHGGCLWLSEAKKDVISCEKPR